jgi:sialidase-1
MHLINTMASGRWWNGSTGIGELLQQFGWRLEKPFKRLKLCMADLHRAKATVLMGICKNLCRVSRLALGAAAVILIIKVQPVGAEEIKLTDVFRAGSDGYHTYRIPAMVVTTNGKVLAFCEGRKNGRGDSGKIDLLLKRSENQGRTWSSQQIVWADGENCCGNPAPVVDSATGFVWLLTTWNLGTDRERDIERGTGHDTRRVFVTHSEDQGRSWTKPVEITSSVKKPEWGWYATGPINGIQLIHGPHKGRLVIPANHSETNQAGQPVSRSHVFFSDDHGKTWQLGGVEDEKTNESTIAELSDGALMQNMRTYSGKNQRAVAISRDYGASWSAAKWDEALIEPVCQGSLLCFDQSKEGARPRLLFSNPASLKREKLTVRESKDDGATWVFSKVIWAGPAAYSCLTVMPDKSIGCLFECGEKNSYERISLATFPLSWLEATGGKP